MAIKKKKENTRVEDKHDDLLSVLLSNNELNNQENNGLLVFLSFIEKLDQTNSPGIY